MKKTLSFLFCFLPLFLLSVPAQAQWRNLPKRLIQKETKEWQEAAQKTLQQFTQQTASLKSLSTKTQTGPSSDAAQSLIQKKLGNQLRKYVLLEKRRQSLALEKEMTRSVFLIQPQPPYYAAATGFVFETQHEGRREVWGLMAMHMAEMMGEKVSASFIKDGKQFLFPGHIVMKGNTHRIDAALIRFEPSTEFLQTVLPLRLATELPAPHAETNSYGHSVAAPGTPFYPVYGAKVLATGPNRILTSYAYAPKKHAGSCGGPMLNSRQEVTGMHCGASTEFAEVSIVPGFLPVDGQNFWPISSSSGRISQSVPAQRVHDLVRAYHHAGSAPTILQWKGLKLGALDVGERIVTVKVLRSGQLLRSYHAQEHEPFLDETHLEKTINTHGGTELHIEVESVGSHPPYCLGKKIEVDLVRGKIIRETTL